MAARSKHRRVLTDSSIPIPNFGSPSFPISHSGSPLFSCASSMTSFKYSGSSARCSCSSPKMEVTSENSNGEVKEWLDAIRSSSPPQVGCIGTQKSQSALEDEEKTPNNDWFVTHPSALDVFEDITGMAQGKQVAVFLDYDGTLSPIVEDPDHAFMSDEMRSALRDVAKHFPTAIITGRCRDKVFEFVQLPELYYAGSHGMDIMGPAEARDSRKKDETKSKEIKGKIVSYQPASEYLPLMDEVCQALKERAKFYKGARVEHNKYCVTVHFRCVKEEIWNTLAEEVRCVLYEYPGLSMTQGRKVLELRPSIEWDKGKALEFLLNALGLENGSCVHPLYIGDDRTDEDAFNVLKDKGYGCGILVSSFAKQTSAVYTLRSPSEVLDFLRRLVRWKLGAVEVSSMQTCTEQVES